MPRHFTDVATVLMTAGAGAWRRRLVLAAAVCAIVGGGLGSPAPRAAEPPLVDGAALRADQVPRFVRPTQTESFGFDPIVIAGDQASVTFERVDPAAASGVQPETWERIETGTVGGRVVSVFRPSWSADQLYAALRLARWGVDRPFLHWGDLRLPDGGRQSVYLRMAPTNVPVSDVVVVSDTVQYASHAVNLWIPNFGDDRLSTDTDSWDLSVVTRKFYDHFADDYATLAIVMQTMQPMSALHRNVQNAVAGIGLPLFDDTAQYGSASVLHGVEVYPSGRWADLAAVLHQQGHQWSDYSQAWAEAGITRAGHDPARHTPLLSPGPVMVGAVLEPTREVIRDGGAPAIARTEPLIRYSPLTLYRMGLVAPGELPAFEVFEDQGQFDPDMQVAPNPGETVGGGTVTVTADDVVAADGLRNGPALTRFRRAVIYVSRDGLASAEEMDVVNYFAARQGASQGVTTWDGYPSFFEATGDRVVMDTAARPASGSGLATPGSPGDVTFPDGPGDVLVGVVLDVPVPGRFPVGETLNLDGTLTLTDRTDYNIVCFRFIRYGATDVNEIFVCGTLDGTRFSVPVTFAQSQRGRYTIEVFAFWRGSGPQNALSRYGVIVIE